MKGLGGYHLAVRADDADAVARLRAAKHREDKPFAVMAADLDAARALVDVEPGAAEVARRRAGAPIVLLPRRPGAAVAPAVAPGNRRPRRDAAPDAAAPPARRASSACPSC